eukprot:5757498-Pyramimonas_sp.AAC.1
MPLEMTRQLLELTQSTHAWLPLGSRRLPRKWNPLPDWEIRSHLYLYLPDPPPFPDTRPRRSGITDGGRWHPQMGIDVIRIPHSSSNRCFSSAICFFLAALSKRVASEMIGAPLGQYSAFKPLTD